ncbi:OsmC family protein [Anaerophaga thermohalophila]|uniref:OsmC family protein n=1 Tax=Anaerophaga thermohalophila TaxID=177400 RepID=UPI0002FDE907|nr:OsmC family protein [Anaerophaga thermohalophila]
MSVTIKSRYLGNLRVESTHLRSGTKIITDAPVDNRGKGESFSPTDLLATSLGSCIMTIMGITAEDNKIDIEGTEVEITQIMSLSPRRVEEVIVSFYFPANGYTEKEKRIIENVAGSSPVPLSISPEVKQTIRFYW